MGWNQSEKLLRVQTHTAINQMKLYTDALLLLRNGKDEEISSDLWDDFRQSFSPLKNLQLLAQVCGHHYAPSGNVLTEWQSHLTATRSPRQPRGVGNSDGNQLQQKRKHQAKELISFIKAHIPSCLPPQH